MKIRVPNTRGHYEMNGFEIDVDDRDIIIRTSSAAENKERYRREDKPQGRKEPVIGPITGGLLKRIGFD